jgi:hypothetical protein
MTIYRIDNTLSAYRSAIEDIKWLVEYDVLVADGRLQAIADALANPPGIPEQEAIDNLGDEYPYLMMLLDALTQEDTGSEYFKNREPIESEDDE